MRFTALVARALRESGVDRERVLDRLQGTGAPAGGSADQMIIVYEPRPRTRAARSG